MEAIYREIQGYRGQNIICGEEVTIGENVTIMHNCIIEDHVVIGDGSYIDSNTIIRRGTSIGKNAFVGSNCIIGEYMMDFCEDRRYHEHCLTIGEDALIRSGSIIYTESVIGDGFQTGHQVTIRENSRIGNHVSIGTLSDIQGNCDIGNYVRAHSNVHIGQHTVIDSFVWVFPYVVFTNDPTPPSEQLTGVHVSSFAIIATGSVILPGIEIGQDALVGAGAIVTKDVDSYTVVAGNPARVVADVRNIKNKITGQPAYPWRDHFYRAMPWSENSFSEWYGALDIEEKEAYQIKKMELYGQ